MTRMGTARAARQPGGRPQSGAAGGPRRRKPADLAPRIAFVVLAAALVVHAALLGSGIGRLFAGVNEDDNAVFGLGALNLARFGFTTLRFGISDAWSDRVQDAAHAFYTHHPQWFVMPSAILDRWFGASDVTTRLPSMILSLAALAALFATVRLATGRLRTAAIAAGAYAVLPGVIHFSSTLSEKAFVLAFSVFLVLAYERLRAGPTPARRVQLVAILALGGLIGWHFAFTGFAIGLAAALDPGMPARRFVLVAVPLVTALTLAANFGHLSLLHGAGSDDLFQYLALRAKPMPPGFFLMRYSFWAAMAFTWAGSLVALGALAVHATRFARTRRLGLPLLLAVQPLLVAILFQEWSGVHAFGPIYWAPFVAFALAQTLEWLVDRGAATKIAAAALVGLVLGWLPVNLGLLRQPFMVDAADVTTLRRLRIEAAPGARIAIGDDPRGFCTSQLVEWYLRRDAHELRWDRDRPDYIVTLNPQLGPAFEDEFQRMEHAGYDRAYGQDHFVVMRRVP